MGWIGFNCSLPHKQSVVKHLDELGKSASLIGAVNCVVRRADRLIGENTDGQGFLTSLRTVANPQGTKVTILGAGGAARAIAIELALAGAAQITIVNRNRERAEELARTVNASTFDDCTAGAMDRRLRNPTRNRHPGQCHFRRPGPTR